MGLGIRVSPGTILFEKIPVGKIFDLEKDKGMIITIYNDSEIGYKYYLKPEKPSESNTKATGYFDFINPSWSWLDTETLSIVPFGEQQVRLYFKIPDSTYYYNRHWLLAISVTPTQAIVDTNVKGGSIALGAYLLYRFETIPDEKAPIRKNETEILTIPSVVEFNDVVPNGMYQRNIIISSNITSKLKLSRLDPNSDVAKITILAGGGYTRLNISDWLLYDKNITLKNGVGNLQLTLVVPEDFNMLNYYEEIIMLSSDDTEQKAFVRIRISPKKTENKN